MLTSTQVAGREMNAGLYLRVKTQLQSLGWSWSKKKSTDFVEAEAERPWAGLAEWLRAAHSLLDEQDGELNHNTDRASQVCAIE